LLSASLTARAGDAQRAVQDFENSLRALDTKQDRAAATRKYFAGLKDSDTKIKAIGLFDDRYVYLVPDEVASEVLGKLLGDTDLKVRVRAVRALGRRQKAGDHFDAVLALLKETDAAGTKHVLYAMGRARDKRFLPAMRAQLNHADPSVRSTVLFELTNYPAAEVRWDMVAGLKDADAGVRGQAIMGLSRDGARSTLIVAMLDDPSEHVRATALQALASFKSDAVIKAVAARLADPHPSVRVVAAQSLARMRATGYLAAVTKLLDNQDVLVRRRLVQALGEFGDRAARPALERALKDDDATVRELALEALGALGDGGAKKVAAGLLTDPAADVRRATVEALTRLGATESVPAILKLLDDKDARVRWMAALAVGRLADKTVLPELRKRLSQADADLRDRLDQAIRAIESRSR
jgi:HEAT repeat protein